MHCGATIYLASYGLSFKWATSPRGGRTWYCGTDPAFPVRGHAPGPLCTCQRAACLGPDPKRPEIRHRIPGIVRSRDPKGYVEVEIPGRTGILLEHRFLVPGRQIPHPLAVIGQHGWLVYRIDGHSGLDYFVDSLPE